MSYRPQVKADSNGTTQDLPIDAETVQGKTPVFTTTNQTISGIKTYNGNQIFTGYLDIRGTAAEKHLKTRGIGGSDGNGNENDLYLQYNSNYSTKFGKSGNGSLNSDGTITEAGTLLSNKYASKSHNHNSDYVSNVVMAPSSSGSRWVSGIPGNFSTDFGDGPVYPVSGTTNIGVGLDEKNITFTPGEGAKRAIGSYDSSTGDYSWTLHGTAGNTKANGHITWTSGDNQLKVTKDGTTRTIGYFNTINGESVISATESKNFSFYTKTETDNKYLPLSGGTLTGNLTGKYITGTWLQTTAAGKASVNTGKVCVLDNNGWVYYRTPAEIVSDGGGATVSHSSESVIDYGDTSNTIKIGYRGNGLTASQIAYIAGYSVDDPNNPNEHKIKDISKDVLKSWLGYAEVTTGELSANTALNVTNGYAFIILVVGTNNYVKFGTSASQKNNTAYHFMFIQGGGPSIARYFSSSTTLSMGTFGSPVSFYFNSTVQYIKFKIG